MPFCSAVCAALQAPFDGLMNNVEEAAKSIKHNILEIRSNVKELTASIQTAVGRGNRSYERMQTKDMFRIAEEGDENDFLCDSSVDTNEQQQHNEEQIQ